MYKAIICRISTKKHPNADRLQLGTAYNFQVITDMSVQDGQVGIFFPPDGQLSEKFAEANDLISRIDENGKKAGGYFGKNRRVRAQNFRGEKSEGFWIPLESLGFTGFDVSQLKEGDQLDELNGVPICNKYFTLATLKGMKVQGRKNACFAQHEETKQFKYEVNNIPAGSMIYITEKLHGTSFWYGHVLDEVRPSFLERLIGFFRKRAPRREWTYLNGTRRTIMGKYLGPGFYGDEEFRELAIIGLKDRLHKGEIFYGEIVGYTTTGQSIMSPQDTSAIKDGEITKKYGEKMLYKYGCPVGICDIYIYRITMVNEDGYAVDIPWTRVKRRCKELGIKTVPEVERYNFSLISHPELLIERVNSNIEGPSTIDFSHIREGVVLRIENEDGVSFLKAKSQTFLILEGCLKDKVDYIDIEEVA